MIAGMSKKADNRKENNYGIRSKSRIHYCKFMDILVYH